ncbi:hypothetical protein G7062_09640 [Erysipelothrix sp. HDW6C]|uniref:hypothetical protein n=1 Tax=Erysipelothrix sp. HDW6C TaxID=2714930 RepID=UPI00140C43A8|nr:hypothetical protein [Erysipelothrix sp. HDW6C]QIK70547.1 hypothetical protein G7062_09640 [Erysipelothrix sp. HDW6C]
MKRIWTRLCVVGLVLVAVVTPISATSGKLKSASITNCRGETFGHQGDGHWHYAAQHDSGWYRVG